MRSLRYAALIITLASPASAADWKKLSECRLSPERLIGLSEAELRERCGLWMRLNKDVYGGVSVRQFVYGDTAVGGVLYVYVRDGKVTAAQAMVSTRT